ncbi:MAG: glycosyltransferase family 39 protein [Acidimicrobiales bacterium]|nr:glycosyltransferase family 39 protein [Acidimicrobiales bacterium]
MTLTDAPPALAGDTRDPDDADEIGRDLGDDATDTPPPAEPVLPTTSGSPWRDRFHAPTRSGWITIAIALVAAGLYTWGLGSAGVANDYYAAAVKAMSTSWKAFFYGSIDSGSFITVDKPPASLWVMALSARIFGFSTWSMLLPQAAAGVASVLIVHRIVREWMGNVAAHLAALGFALTPVAVVMFRYNNPDALLTLLGLGSAWAIWIALKTGRTRWLVLSAALVGLAFETKMLQALVVLPAFVAVYLFFGPPKLGKRIWQLALAAVTVLVSAGWWIAIVALVPASSRPYIGSTEDNSIISLVLGYNGLSRIFGSEGGGPGGSGGATGGGAGFGGAVSWLRMFNTEVGGQVAWLIPLALVGLGAGLWLTRRNPRTDLARAGWVLWGAWAVVSIVVFSRAEGIFHPYYTVQLAPAVAALAGAGAVALWQLGRRHPATRWFLPATIVVTAGVAVTILRRTPDFASWLPMAIIIGAALSAAGVWIGASLRHRTLTLAAASIAGVTLLAGPTAYSLTTIAHTQTGSLAAAGPTSTSAGGGFPGMGGGDGGTGPGVSSTSSIDGDTELVAWLEANQGDATWLVAAFSSHSSASIILATDEPVMTIGGFNGQDPAPTLDEFIEYVEQGELRYVLVDGGGGLGGGMGGGPGGGTSEITTWVTENGTAVDTGTGTTVYDLSALASTVADDD